MSSYCVQLPRVWGRKQVRTGKGILELGQSRSHHFRDTKLHLPFSLREFGLGADARVSLHQMSTSSWGDVGPAQLTH